MLRSTSVWIRCARYFLLAWFPLLAALPLLGTPGTLPAGGGDRQADRFPCETHRCGCTGSASCWDVCCCYSPIAMAAWALDAGVSLPPGMEEYAALVPESAPRVDQACRTLLAAPGDPFQCKGVALGLLFHAPALVFATSGPSLPAPRISRSSPRTTPVPLSALDLDQPDPPPRRSSVS